MRKPIRRRTRGWLPITDRLVVKLRTVNAMAEAAGVRVYSTPITPKRLYAGLKSA